MPAFRGRLIAETLLADRIRQLQEQRRNKVLLGVEDRGGLQEYASRHLVLKQKSGRTTDRVLVQLETQLRRACEHFGSGRELASITVNDVQGFTEWLQQEPNGRGGTLGPGTVRSTIKRPLEPLPACCERAARAFGLPTRSET
jgi:hypothetical protein